MTARWYWLLTVSIAVLYLAVWAASFRYVYGMLLDDWPIFANVHIVRSFGEWADAFVEIITHRPYNQYTLYNYYQA